MTDFFEKKDDQQQEEMQDDAQNQEEAPQEDPQKIAIGESEYTQEELEGLVGLGQKAKEWSEKSGSDIDKLKETFGKRAERIGELKKKVEELESKESQVIEKKQAEGQELSPEEQSKAIKEELKKYGVVTKEDFDQYYQQRREGERILAKTKRIIKDNVKKGLPNVDEKVLLEFMANPDNPKDPEKAYKIMHEKEIDQWKADRLASKKPAGMVTEDTSTAGGKQPSIKPPRTEEELKKALRQHLFEAN